MQTLSVQKRPNAVALQFPLYRAFLKSQHVPKNVHVNANKTSYFREGLVLNSRDIVRHSIATWEEVE